MCYELQELDERKIIYNEHQKVSLIVRENLHSDDALYPHRFKT